MSTPVRRANHCESSTLNGLCAVWTVRHVVIRCLFVCIYVLRMYKVSLHSSFLSESKEADVNTVNPQVKYKHQLLSAGVTASLFPCIKWSLCMCLCYSLTQLCEQSIYLFLCKTSLSRVEMYTVMFDLLNNVGALDVLWSSLWFLFR